MEHDMRKGASRRQKQKPVHFRTVRWGGFDEFEMLGYLWSLVKSLEAIRSETLVEHQEEDGRLENKTGPWKPGELEKQLRNRIRVELRRYFLRQKRRNRRLIIGTAFLAVCAVGLFGFLIGVDRVSGTSMYPYLNHGDWIVYSRLGGELRRGEVVVFEKNGESMVKRITGLPGDQVEISASGYRVVVNGTQIRESYVNQTNLFSQEEYGQADQMSRPWTVMDDQYLVLGDNRSVSIDSRDSEIGTVPAGDIFGRVILVLRLHG